MQVWVAARFVGLGTYERDDRNHASNRGEIIPRLPTPLKIRLSNLEEVRQEMSKVYRDARSNRLDSQDASRLVYMLGQIAKMLETNELVRRVEALEEVRNDRLT